MGIFRDPAWEGRIENTLDSIKSVLGAIAVGMNAQIALLDQIANRPRAEMAELKALVQSRTDAILSKETQSMATIQEALAALTDEVAQTVGVQESALVFIQGLKDQIAQLIAAGSITPEQLQALSDQLDAEKNKVAAAIAANP